MLDFTPTDRTIGHKTLGRRAKNTVAKTLRLGLGSMVLYDGQKFLGPGITPCLHPRLTGSPPAAFPNLGQAAP